MKDKIYRVSGASAISVTVAPGEPWELEGMKLHLSGSGVATDLTVTVDSAYGASYDTVLYTKGMGGVADIDYRWNPTPKFIHEGDKIVIVYANSGSETWGLEVAYKLLEQEVNYG